MLSEEQKAKLDLLAYTSLIDDVENAGSMGDMCECPLCRSNDSFISDRLDMKDDEDDDDFEDDDDLDEWDDDEDYSDLDDDEEDDDFGSEDED